MVAAPPVVVAAPAVIAQPPEALWAKAGSNANTYQPEARHGWDEEALGHSSCSEFSF